MLIPRPLVCCESIRPFNNYRSTPSATNCMLNLCVTCEVNNISTKHAPRDEERADGVHLFAHRLLLLFVSPIHMASMNIHSER